MRRLLLTTALCFAATAAAHAQIGIYAGFTESKLNVANTDWIHGGTFGAYYDSHHFPVVNFGIDARVAVLNSDPATKVTSGLIGPRAVLHVPVVPIRPYGEALVGMDHGDYGPGVANGQGASVSTSTSFDFGFALGADLHILPYLDWRAIDFTYTRLQNTSSNNEKSITTGLVFRIPLS